MAGIQRIITMNQEETNTQAMANIFAIEDSKDLFEAIGALNDDQMAGVTEDPNSMEYGPDDMMRVIPGSTDPYAGQSMVSQAQQEPTVDDQRFVIDRFSELMANEHKNVVDTASIDGLSPIIQAELGTGKMNVNQFLTDMKTAASQRLASQNVSEALPSGAAADGIEPQGADTAAAPADPNAGTMGTPPMEPAPGGIAVEPSLDAIGADDGLGDFGAAPADDGLGLDNIPSEGDGELGPEGGDDLGAMASDEDFGADGFDSGSEGGDTLGLDDIPAEDGAGAEGGDDLGLDDIPSDDTGDAGLGGEEGAEKGDEFGGDDTFGDGSNLDSLSDESLDSEDDESVNEGGAEDDDAAFEAEMSENKAILESIYAQYREDVARNKVHSLVEAHVRDRQAQKKAQLEASIAAFKKESAEQKLFESKSEEMRNALGSKVGSLVEAERADRAQAILESASKAFARASARKKRVSGKLKATLESISADYHKAVAKKKTAAKPMTETAARPSLSARLKALVDSVD